ncbi:hypothetical protein LTR86_004721 [Recurvomyces mirabilis]|nr:hypothetical protein LTR86_004721 [Recurvomyces mirabilis]
MVSTQPKPADVSGAHAWQAPTADQQRGPCPGLNALANYGYISRDGVVSLPEAISTVTSVFNMGLDLATLLATLGIVSVGAPVSLNPKVSIGSESKDDILVALPEDEGPDTAFDSMSDFAVNRFKQSVGSNPNHTTLKSFYGLTGSSDSNSSYTYGHERIPLNWYPRPTAYGLAEPNQDITSWTLKHPELANIGGNTRTTNSFTPFDLSNLTGGVLATPNLLEGNNLLCFALEFVKLAAPWFTNNVFETLREPLDLVLTSLSVPLLSLQCPEWKALTGGGENILDPLGQYSIPGQDQGLL